MATRPAGPQIELKAVGKAYAGQIVLANVELTVARGMSVAVLVSKCGSPL